MRQHVWLMGLLLYQGCFLFETERPSVDDDTGVVSPETTCPNLGLSVETLDWQNVPHGTSSKQMFEVTNQCVGTGILTTSFAMSDGTFFALSSAGEDILPNEVAQIEVVFSPLEPGVNSDTITVRGSDGTVIEVSLTGQSVLNPDWDGDGFDSIEAGGDDCDDADDRVYPGAPDACYDGLDRNCDKANEYDCDQDGYEAIAYGGSDCDDADDVVYPSAPEIRNGNDDDCDGLADQQLIQKGDVVFSEFNSIPIKKNSISYIKYRDYFI